MKEQTAFTLRCVLYKYAVFSCTKTNKNMLPGVSSEGSEADDVSGPWGGKGAV